MDDHTLQVLEYASLKDYLATFAPSDLSRRIIARMKPSTDAARLRVSLNQVDEARALLDGGCDLRGLSLHDMNGVISAAHSENRALGAGELLLVQRMIQACGRLKDLLSTRQQEAPSLWRLADGFSDHSELEAAILAVVEPPAEVLDSASERLWSIRRKRRLLEDSIRDQMNELAASKRYRPFLQERSWTLRNGRHVLLVRTDSRGHVPGILHDKSSSGETSFVEPTEIVASSNELAELQLDEDREVTRLLIQISKRVFDENDRLAETQRSAAWIEFTVARARMSQDLGYVSARLRDDYVIALRGAKHPLLQKAEREGRLPGGVVPVSITLGRDHGMIVVTGPNTGGKTVCLKTAGLIQLMFQSGLHVPASAGTELPCLQAIFADIGDEQSLSQNLSTFSGHIRNMVPILRSNNEGTLVLLDELGAGTDPAEGAALGEAILERLRAQRALVLVTTHLGSLKTFAFSHGDVENASMAFDQMTLQPTYQLLTGQPGSSHALEIARRHGIPEAVIVHARKLAMGSDRSAEELMDKLLESRLTSEAQKEASARLLVDSEEKLIEANRALDDAIQAKERVESEAESEVAALLAGFAESARPHLNALKNVPRALLAHVDAIEGLLKARLRTKAFSERRREFLAGLKRYDQVWVPKFSQACRIEKFNRSEERLSVKVGELLMEIGFDDISWVTPPSAH
ncbi:MAG TPA: hypothetical protein PKA37_04700 [Planctomycetota bacterium]|nr:hypothetical protein [Planctomycetota bacterium]